MKKLWEGRFTHSLDQNVEKFLASIFFDHKLLYEDILGSLAHAKTLEKSSLLTEEESSLLQKALLEIYEQANAKNLTFSEKNEDIHMNIEKILEEKIHSLAGKLHTGRSRNDQIALDMHLYLRSKCFVIIEMLMKLMQSFIEIAVKEKDTIIPGYTHLQRAQPILFSHHMLCYFWMFSRDVDRLIDSFSRINKMPLGSGALAGSNFSLDRSFTMEILGFDDIYFNSMDAVSDRDFIVEFHANASIIMMHMSRLSEELILWNSEEFSLVSFSDAYCTGSSIMPQKKNPDIPELIRGKTGRVYGNLLGILTVLKGLPLTYNKDMQEDKEGLFDTVDTLEGSLQALCPLIQSMQVKKPKDLDKGFMCATDLADFLVSKNIPFRKAHEIVGKVVKYCIDNDQDLTSVDLQKFSKEFSKDLSSELSLKNSIQSKKTAGSTSFIEVQKQLESAKNILEEKNQWLKLKKKSVNDKEKALFH